MSRSRRTTFDNSSGVNDGTSSRVLESSSARVLDPRSSVLLRDGSQLSWERSLSTTVSLCKTPHTNKWWLRTLAVLY